MESLLPLIIQLVVGAIGGNAGAAAVKNANLGPILNSIVGAIGGAGAGSVLGPLIGMATTAGSNGIDLGNIASSGIGGIVLTIVAGLIKNAMAPK